jgi:ubiquinone/menaquinone biosynthesis C-methylase UbiE
MSTYSETLSRLTAGRILDVATGSGGFVNFLLENKIQYTGIIGIDTSERAEAAFAEAFKDQPHIHFKHMDAARMAYPDASFDTVCIANSLHHLPDLDAVLSEMKRVLCPGGNFILLEMYCDGQTETQMTHVYLHHWWAAVDQAQGVIHNQTFTRQEILEITSRLTLKEVEMHDLSDTETDPLDPETIEQLDGIIDRYIQKAEGHPDLQQRGEELRSRVHEIGFHSAASLLVIGRK